MRSKTRYRLKMKDIRANAQQPPLPDFGKTCVCCNALGCSMVQMAELADDGYSLSIPICPACKGHVKTHITVLERISIGLMGIAMVFFLMACIFPTARSLWPIIFLSLPGLLLLFKIRFFMAWLGGEGHHGGFQIGTRGKAITIHSTNQELIERLMLQGIRADWKVVVKPPFTEWGDQ